ncbi:DUF6461 domain-containing protein [Nocardia sp. alder85J]|uniref:DUF6461 domain-containing protein n=1 Tax=Nocardia sp. alder85J TaxID=2862949 RepID=UPI001CD51C3B|nr:DUF6461 domain-containing protein [Nocardia sp. alder85J]MCX4091910.1 DUF6461 domain-containing protein [Nocardia sp. alder85J]
MADSAGAGYTSDWVDEAGLDLDTGYCVTFVRGVGPREVLRRLGVDDAAIRTATWAEFVAQNLQREMRRLTPGVAAAFVMGEYVVLVEDIGYWGRLPEWAEPVSRGTETLNVYLSPTSQVEELSIYQDGKRVASISGDEPEVIESGDAEMAGRLIELTFEALGPWNENDPAPEDFSDGRVDLLKVACGYLGLHPEISDINGPVVGALVEYR